MLDTNSLVELIEEGTRGKFNSHSDSHRDPTKITRFEKRK